MSLLSSSPSDDNTSSSSNSFRDSPIPTASFLFATEFIHGAGVVIFHRSSSRVVLIHDRADPSAGYFFPKGRKDIGESLPQAATREGHEESGFPNRLLPVRIPTRQPTVENGSINAAKLMLHNIGKSGSSGRRKRIEKSTEAVYTHFMPFRRGRSWPKGGVYILSWFIAEVTDDDVQRIEAAQAEKLREDEEKRKKKREEQGGGGSSSGAAESWQDWINCLNEEGMSPNGVKSSSGATTTDGDGKVKALKPLDEHELQYKAELVPYDVARKRLRSNWVMLQLFETALVLVKDLDNDDDDDNDAGEEEDESKNVKEY